MCMLDLRQRRTHDKPRTQKPLPKRVGDDSKTSQKTGVELSEMTWIQNKKIHPYIQKR